MAGIDYTIPGQFKGIQLESPMNQMAQALQLRNLQETSQMNALKAQEAQRQTLQRNALARIHADPKVKPGTPEYFSRVAQEAPDLFEAVSARELQRENLAAQREARTAQTEEREFQLGQKKEQVSREKINKAIADIASFDDLASIQSDIERKLTSGELTEEQANKMRAGLPADDSGVPDWQRRTFMSLMDLKERVAAMRDEGKPMVVEGNLVSPTGRVIYEGERKPVPVAPGGQLVNPKTGEVIFSADAAEAKPIPVAPGGQLVNPKTGEVIFAAPAAAPAPTPAQRDYQAAVDAGFKGSFPDFLDQQRESEMEREYRRAKAEGYKGSFLDWKKANKQATNLSVNTPAPVTAVTIQDPNDPTKAIVVDARTGKLIGASVKEGPGVNLTAKERQTREAKYPQATAAIKTYESKSELLAKDLEKLANHPGLSGISGFIFGRTPSGTKDSMAAQALYDSIIARGGFKELQDMRAASPTGGALGNVSNQEGQYLRDAFAPISRTQATEDLAAALKNAAGAVRDSKGRIREAYDMTYEYRGGGEAAPVPPATPNAPSVGTIKDGYKFKGGNPADKNNWEKVK